MGRFGGGGGIGENYNTTRATNTTATATAVRGSIGKPESPMAKSTLSALEKITQTKFFFLI